MNKKITPHKGGRTVYLSGCRLTEAEKEAVKKMLTDNGISLSDFLSKCAGMPDEVMKLIQVKK